MGKGSPWTNEEVKALIHVWAKASIQQQLDGAVQNKSVYKDVAKHLHEVRVEKSFNSSSSQVSVSLSNPLF